MNPKNLNIAPISTTDTDGVHWTFDHASNRWSAVVNGKRMSTTKGQSFLQDKVKSALSQQNQQNKAPERSIFEMALIQVRHDRNGVNFTPIVARVEWNGAPGVEQYEILRYKEVSKKSESGWRKGDSDVLVVHPDFVSDDLLDLVRIQAIGDVVSTAFKQAKRQIATSWWDQKQNITRWLEKDRNDHFSEITADEAARKSRGYQSSRDLVSTSSQWPMALPGQDFSAWIAQPDGSLARGPVRVVMKSKSGGMVFSVMADGFDHALHTGSELDVAMSLAQATHDLIQEGRAPTTEWMGYKDWIDDRASWPDCYEILGGAIVLQPRDRYSKSSLNHTVPVGYVLAKQISSGWGEPRTDHSIYNESKDQVQMRWRPMDSYRAINAFAASGPEDAMLGQIVELDASRRQVEQNHLREVKRETVAAACQDTLRLMVGSIENGEEVEVDARVVGDRFERIRKAVEQQARGTQWLADWLKQCEGAVERAKALTTTTKTNAVKTVSNKPGR